MPRPTRPSLPSALQNRNIVVGARRTSMRLEPELWHALETIALRQGRAVRDITTEVGAAVEGAQALTSAIRIYIVRHLRPEAA